MLGTFGDSYADPNSPSGDRPWMDVLAHKLNLPVENYGRSGTSIWYSYEKFIKHYSKYSHIVFTYSHFDRLNHLPESYAGNHCLKLSFLKSVNNVDYKFRSILHTYYKYLHNESLQLFLYQKIYEDVHRICTENNIKIVHNFPFEPCMWKNIVYVNLNNTRNVLGASTISTDETNTYKKGTRTTLDFGVPDRRVCHFSQPNNIILGNIIFDLFNCEEKTVYLNKSMFNFDYKELDRLFYK